MIISSFKDLFIYLRGDGWAEREGEEENPKHTPH